MNTWKIKDAARQLAQVVTVTTTTTTSDAKQIMQSYQIHHLVVTDGAKVSGIVSDRDLWAKEGSLIRNVMTPLTPDQTVTERTDLRQALSLMRTLGSSGLPVMRQGELVGIVTETDLLRLLEKLLAQGTEGPHDGASGKSYALFANPLVQNLMQLLAEAGI